MNVQKTTVYLTSEELAALRRIAREAGCMQTRGPGSGTMTSLSRLMRAIARGELTVAKDGQLLGQDVR